MSDGGRTRSRSPIRIAEETGDDTRHRSQSPRRRENSDRKDIRRPRDGSATAPRPRADTRTRSERTVYVSNIPYDIKWQELKDVFRENTGEVVRTEIEYVKGKSKGCGFVEFLHVEDAKKAIDKMNRFQLKDRQLVVKEMPRRRHSPSSVHKTGFGGGPGPYAGMMGGGMGPGGGGGGGGSLNALGLGLNQNALQALQEMNTGSKVCATVFVANLDYEVGWKKIKDIFKVAGNVKRVDLRLDKEGKSRGFGTVEFESPFEAINAVSMFHGQILHNRPMTVKIDEETPPAPRGGPRPPVQPDSRRPPFQSQQNLPPQNLPPPVPPQVPAGPAGAGGLGALGSQLNVLNLLQTLVGAQGAGGGQGVNPALSGLSALLGGNLQGLASLAQLGATAGGPQQPPTLPPTVPGLNPTAPPNYDRRDRDPVSMSYSPDASVMRDFRPAQESYPPPSTHSPSPYRGDTRQPTGGDYNNSYNGNRSYDNRQSYDRQSRFDRPTGQTASLGNQVFVRNLPFSLNWQQLKDHFRNVGRVTFAEIKTDNEGKSKGCGTVRFETSEEADRAVSFLNGMNLDGRKIEVHLDRLP